MVLPCTITHAGCKDDYTSTSAYIIYLGHNPISWSSKKQHTIAHSSTEVEYRVVSSLAVELSWICSLLTELGICVPATRHVSIDYHFIRDQVQSGALCVNHVSSEDQLVDVLTKPLLSTRFQLLKIKIRLSS
ncbi:Retrovirus-related Pol polyprotein from transposon TNT 1-94 [Gossypium australe]|uniref:Retrovirus-related Pol polyprotein from transposon TNT 1-94 n=1 Tax=Gossypium australe TaxID=47621 RepID=A0A5B6U3S4_9ROSI|nr:Retrovirus-related Pol polyprotein from transposon TNT 1-94 [Gossypium australe]